MQSDARSLRCTEEKKDRTDNEIVKVTFNADLTVGLPLAGLKIRRWLKIVDTNYSRRGFIVYNPRAILLGAHFRALPINVVYRGAATYFQLAVHEVVVRHEKLKADLGHLPFGLVRVQRTVRFHVGWNGL